MDEELLMFLVFGEWRIVFSILVIIIGREYFWGYSGFFFGVSIVGFFFDS